MAIFRLKIVGVHYAVNADEESVAVETEEMHNRTATRLSELDRRRPLVVLIPDTTNPVDARAVMAHVEGKRIGYVSKTQLDTVYALFKAAGRQTLIARIDEVNAVKHGWMYVTVQTDEDVLVEPLQTNGKGGNVKCPSSPPMNPDLLVWRPRRCSKRYCPPTLLPASTWWSSTSAYGTRIPCTTSATNPALRASII